MKSNGFSLVVALGLLLAGRGFAEEASGVDLALFAGPKWSFNKGPEFPGAVGATALEKVDGRDALTLSYDFSGGGGYVAARVPIEIPEGYAQLKFEAKADRMVKVVVRLIDSTHQVHQFQLVYDQVPGWQSLQVPLAQPSAKHFGGANDGVIHYPLKELWLAVGKGGTTVASPGSITFASSTVVKQ